MGDKPETIEDAAAGLLNGVMICLLGSAFPAIFIWQVVSHWGRGDLDLSLAALSDLTPFLGGMFLSLLFLRTGVRLLRENAGGLRRRRSVPPPD
ncbi:MAG: hypothetical protein HYU62_07355 [Caulobacterales bacterium]|nr:hypothetical protein [Caulobacterales bacterium]